MNRRADLGGALEDIDLGGITRKMPRVAGKMPRVADVEQL